MSCFLIDFSSHIEIREPRGGDENYMPPMSFISFHNIEIREPRGGDENYMPPMSFISFHNIEIREPRGGDENLTDITVGTFFTILR